MICRGVCACTENRGLYDCTENAESSSCSMVLVYPVSLKLYHQLASMTGTGP